MKYFILFLTIAVCKGAVIRVPLNNGEDFSIEQQRLQDVDEIVNHVMDVLAPVDMDYVRGVLFSHFMMNNDLKNFIAFLSSQEFTDILEDVQKQPEFKEAISYLKSKGYDVQALIDHMDMRIEPENPSATKAGDGLTRFIDDIIKSLPLEEMKKILQNKIETVPKIAHIFETVTSDEFLDIIKRFLENPEIVEIREVFESYGVDFNYLKALAEAFFGDLSTNKVVTNYLMLS